MAVRQPSDAAADGWAFGAPHGGACAATPPAAAAASDSDKSTSSDSSAGGSDGSSEDSGQPAIGNLSRREPDAPQLAAAGAELAATATEPAAEAAPEAVSVGLMPPPGAEELTPEELAFFGYSTAQVAAAPQPVEQPEASSSSSSSDGDSSSSDDSSDSSGSEADGVGANIAEGGSAEELNGLNGVHASDDLERAMEII